MSETADSSSANSRWYSTANRVASNRSAPEMLFALASRSTSLVETSSALSPRLRAMVSRRRWIGASGSSVLSLTSASSRVTSWVTSWSTLARFWLLGNASSRPRTSGWSQPCAHALLTRSGIASKNGAPTGTTEFQAPARAVLMMFWIRSTCWGSGASSCTVSISSIRHSADIIVISSPATLGLQTFPHPRDRHALVLGDRLAPDLGDLGTALVMQRDHAARGIEHRRAGRPRLGVGQVAHAARIEIGDRVADEAEAFALAIRVLEDVRGVARLGVRRRREVDHRPRPVHAVHAPEGPVLGLVV